MDAGGLRGDIEDQRGSSGGFGGFGRVPLGLGA